MCLDNNLFILMCCSEQICFNDFNMLVNVSVIDVYKYNLSQL